MPKKVLVVTLTAILILSAVLQVVKLADANPTWGKPATPKPPITDPPQVIINSPTVTEYSNPVPLAITIIQPDSWGTNQSSPVPRSYVDNSDTVVVGQNRLRSITCIIDGQSFSLWDGTHVATENWVTYYLPKITQFSAELNVSRGSHQLQIDVVAISDYVTEGIIPFAEKEYVISANQTTRFFVTNGSGAISPAIDKIQSSYSIWKASSTSPPAFQSQNPTATPTVPELSWLTLFPVCLTILSVALLLKHRGKDNPVLS